MKLADDSCEVRLGNTQELKQVRGAEQVSRSWAEGWPGSTLLLHHMSQTHMRVCPSKGLPSSTLKYTNVICAKSFPSAVKLCHHSNKLL